MADSTEIDPQVDLRRPLLAFVRRCRRLQVRADFGLFTRRNLHGDVYSENPMAIFGLQRHLARAQVSMDTPCAKL